MMDLNGLLLFTILLPLVGALGMALFGRYPNIREGITLTTAIILLLQVINIYDYLMAGRAPEAGPFEVLPGLAIHFAVEPLGMLFALIASTLWIINSIYSIGYMRGNDESRQTQFYICFAVSLFGVMGIAFAANLFTLFLFYEVLTLATYPLVAHKANEEAKKGARLYLMLLLCTSMGLLLPAIVWTNALAGTMDFTPGGILEGNASPLVMTVLMVLFMFGIGKAALMPIHFWLPAAMVAPTPVSALLHAVAVVKAGVFTVVKVIVYIFGIDVLAANGAGDWLLYAAGFTVLVASLVAVRQDNLKKRLAYSTVSQLSYVILAAAILTPISAIGAALHIAAHAVSKITLFFAAGSIYTAAHKTEISQLNGIGWKMPITMTAFAVGAISMIGLPPTAGFLGKWFMLSSAVSADKWLAVWVIVLSTLLNTAYFLPIIYRAFLLKPDVTGDHGEAPLPILIAISATATGTVLLFLFPGVAFDLAERMVGR
ncbi:MAG: monovalent cation/H+ antiporter subunit D family protein [Pseudomonadota bacterium]